MVLRSVWSRISDENDIIQSVHETRSMAEALEFTPQKVNIVCVVVAELARDILEYSGHGDLIIASVHLAGRNGVEISAKDHGPEPKVELFLSGIDQHGVQHRRQRLLRIRQMMDEFEIVSLAGSEIRIVARLWNS